jgi:hypothetical protein
MVQDMRNRTPTKGIQAGDIVRPTLEAIDTLGVPSKPALVRAVKKHIIDGKPERTLVIVAFVGGAREALHETWLEKVA